ncbi:hypothetical protein [Micromonospora sp. WMMD1082]|uniref:hypothetical protein n=1 Tax=Micromonospora sp. WMMD1082 TaxID=3016104 RepID=UPI0024171E07|nr:hypothetical protein [Micromonospora sp. WMMD1082]MDG4792745.1 hypothetical protein [Micromonospora sp. WMMD1082]
MTEPARQVTVPVVVEEAPEHRTLDELIDELRHRPGTEQTDIVLSLLETARTLLPAATLGKPISEADLDDVRGCLRALSVSMRVHLWRQRE